MYRSKFLIYIAFVALFLLACGDEDINTSEKCTALDAATGILLADENGSLLGDIGQAYTLEYQLLINTSDVGLFPNPCIDVLSAIYEGDRAEVVIVPATKLVDCMTTDLSVSDIEFKKSDIEQSAQNIEFEIGGGGNILSNIDVSGLNEGFYNLLLITSESDVILSKTTFYINRSLAGNELYDFLAEGWE